MTQLLPMGLLMAALLLLAAALATRPWWRGAAAATLGRRRANAAAYRTRLAELEAEREAGVVAPADFEALKSELDARLLADARGEEAAAPPPQPRRWLPVLLLTLLLAVFAGGGYVLSDSWRAQQQLQAYAVAGDQVSGMVQQLVDHLQQQPDDPQGWAMLGRSYFVMQRYGEAAKAYAEANARAASPDPDWLAGQGEALAFARERDLQGTPAQLFEQALQIDPDFGKALWYAGLAAAQGGDAATARAHWSKLVAQADLPEQMRQVVQAQLQKLNGPAEAAAPALAAGAAPARPAAAGSGTTLDLQVSLAPELASKVPAGAVLFVFAKAEQGPPMPLAVQRLPGQQLPAEIHLDDSMAMAPSLTLSSFDRYVVTARLSGGGGAQAQSGDLEGSVHVARADAGKPVQLKIDRVIP
jgi:cytochrome c-type biogenesis protein CcmH